PAGPQTLRIRDVGDTLGVGVDMIFDSTGTFSETAWRRWLDSADVKTVFAGKRSIDAAFFDNVALYFDVGADDEFGFKEQNEDFDRFLREEAGIADHIFEVYPGYRDTPAGHWDLIQSRLRKLIKFHDQHFVRPPSPNP
ncbi:MAG TPA: hypothetical protein VM118_07075, partial [Acidobacteriota bacterium]|nr:hypothetical protein [Acidobacteriota bacterium]